MENTFLYEMKISKQSEKDLGQMSIPTSLHGMQKVPCLTPLLDTFSLSLEIFNSYEFFIK